MKRELVIFSLTSSVELAEEVAALLNVKLSKSEICHFADGEMLARPIDNVRGKVVYIIQSTSSPVSQRLMELLIFCDGLRNANAEEINVVIPYYGFSRQDRIARVGEPITAKLVANLLATAGVSHVITVDLHTPQIQGFFSCPVDDLSPISLFGKYYRDKLKDLGIRTEDVTVVSPDHGSIHRARDLASELPLSTIAIIDKRRPAPNTAEVVNVVGDIKGKTCIITDDIIDTAGTTIASIKTLYDHGAKNVLVSGTHGIFSGGAEDKLCDANIKDLVVTNTIEQKHRFAHTISIAPMIAGVIKASEEGNEVPDSWLSFY